LSLPHDVVHITSWRAWLIHLSVLVTASSASLAILLLADLLKLSLV